MSEDLAKLIKKLGTLDEDQLSKLIDSLDGEEAKPKRKRGRPRKNQTETEIEPIRNPPRRNGGLITGPRHNTFDESPLKNEHKSDSKIDASLTKNMNGRVSSRRAKFEYTKATCTRCDSVVEVHPSLTWRDDETKQIVCNCNKCSNRRR